ncbi:MAG TPA: endo-1,4-beta-xylanase [Gemmataceae bacterium]|nr:endo-1,4-beta-xylanase [Gemmataceae bacterium]
MLLASIHAASAPASRAVAGKSETVQTLGADDASVSLRQVAEARGLQVGAAAFPEGLREAPYANLLATHFNVLTPENAMKWQPVHPGVNTWHFEPADALVRFAVEHQLKVHGHTLVWHRQFPDYIQALPGDKLRQALHDHIRTLVGRYKGRVYAWDVVNEALDDVAGLRKNLFLEQLGEDYIAEAFRIAHAADPDALLFYNDYGCDALGPKSQRQFDLLCRLLAADVPVHGVGLQMHITASKSPRPCEVAANVRRLAELGLRVRISEMDVRVSDLPCAPLQIQAAVYGGILRACARESGFLGITFWGITDKYSWVHKEFAPDQPLLFDAAYEPKPAFAAVRDALLGKEEPSNAWPSGRGRMRLLRGRILRR